MFIIFISDFFLFTILNLYLYTVKYNNGPKNIFFSPSFFCGCAPSIKKLFEEYFPDLLILLTLIFFSERYKRRYIFGIPSFNYSFNHFYKTLHHHLIHCYNWILPRNFLRFLSPDRFKHSLNEWTESCQLTVTEINGIADNLDGHFDRISKAKIGGSAAGIAGGIMAAVGFGLSFVTFGASLGLIIAGKMYAITCQWKILW